MEANKPGESMVEQDNWTAHDLMRWADGAVSSGRTKTDYKRRVISL